jgi:hypothetical protein
MDECEFCGCVGCHWTQHGEARADEAAWASYIDNHHI